MHLPHHSNNNGYCPHGKYVGGIGWDIMCGYCESGWTDKNYMIDRLLVRSEPLELYWHGRIALSIMEHRKTRQGWVEDITVNAVQLLEEAEEHVNWLLEDWSATEQEKKFVWNRLHGYWFNKMLADRGYFRRKESDKLPLNG